VRGPSLYFCPDLCRIGGAFRKGDYVNVGFGRLEPHAVAPCDHRPMSCDFLRTTVAEFRCERLVTLRMARACVLGCQDTAAAYVRSTTR
jgi:hypothetical protein